MWILFAFGSAFFAGITAILAKIGVKDTDSNLLTALRTAVVFVFAWIIVLITGAWNTIEDVTPYTWIFLCASGITTGASWICYFRALQIGDINKVVPIDKSSVVLSILLGVIVLAEPISLATGICIALIAVGTLLMINKKSSAPNGASNNTASLIYAVLSAVFAALTALLSKIGITGIDSNLGTAVRTGVVLVMAWGIVFASGKHKLIKEISKKSMLFIFLSGLATGLSWLCYYRALQDGAMSVVVPIDKLSIVISVAFAYIVFKEKLSLKAFIGLILLVAGTLGMVFFK